MLSPGAVAFDHGRPRRGDRSTKVEPSLDLAVLKHLALTFDQTGVLFGVTQVLQFKFLTGLAGHTSLTRRFSELPDHDGDHDRDG
jgi:hypothetical protein